MGIGYVLGCLASILYWKLDRQNIFIVLNLKLKKLIRNNLLIQVFYITFIAAMYYLSHKISMIEVFNGVAAFLVIDISNTERKSLGKKEKVRFYESISLISRAVVCGFIAPLFYILVFGNAVGIVYMLIYNIALLDEKYKMINSTYALLSIIPSLIAEIFLYGVYLCRNRRVYIDFRGDYILNTFFRPLLNVDILGAYIESVNFYYHYSSKNMDYLKSYGEHSKKVDEVCIKDYLSISYGVCIFIFVIFYIITRHMK